MSWFSSINKVTLCGMSEHRQNFSHHTASRICLGHTHLPVWWVFIHSAHSLSKSVGLNEPPVHVYCVTLIFLWIHRFCAICASILPCCMGEPLCSTEFKYLYAMLMGLPFIYTLKCTCTQNAQIASSIVRIFCGVCTSVIFLSVYWEWDKSYPEDHNQIGIGSQFSLFAWSIVKMAMDQVAC
jgi:hypothetical protein